MSNPKFAQPTDNGRYYVLPTGERFPSVTNALDGGVNKQALVPWAAKVTDEAWAANLPRAVKASRNPDRFQDFRKDMKRQVRVVKDTAADLGTRIHAHAEARVLGKPIAEDDECEPFVDQLLDAFDRLRIDITKDVEATEATIVNRTHGYAGTGDLWAWLRLSPTTLTWGRVRHLWLLDYKSSSTRPVDSTYPEHGMQLAALANGQSLLLDDGTELDPPGPIAGTAVLNLRTNGWALVPVPADREAAMAGFLGALHTTTYLHSLSGKPPAIQAPAVRSTTTKRGAA